MKIYENASREYTKDEIISEFLGRIHDICSIWGDNETIVHAILSCIDGGNSELPSFVIESKTGGDDFGGSLAGMLHYSNDELQRKVENSQCRDFIIRMQEMMNVYPKDTLVIKILEELDNNYFVYPIGTEEDKEYNIQIGENYFPSEKERVNICGELASTYKNTFGKKIR